MVKVLVKLHSISLSLNSLGIKCKSWSAFFQMLFVTRYFAVSQTLSFGKLKKLTQLLMVTCVLVQETNQLFIEEVLLKTKSLMKRNKTVPIKCSKVQDTYNTLKDTVNKFIEYS